MKFLLTVALIALTTTCYAAEPVIVSEDRVFRDCAPQFSFEEAVIPSLLRWQVSREPNFSHVTVECDLIQDSDGTITVDGLALETLEPEVPYYLRAQWLGDDEWSAPYTFTYFAKKKSTGPTDAAQKPYVKTPYCPQDIWDSVSICFLPSDHPAKGALDQIFSASRATADLASLKKAGFKDIMPGKYSSQVVARHPKVPGYLFKLYTDLDPLSLDWSKFKTRVLGANQVRQSIEALGYTNLFVVPHKWIYPLPATPDAPVGSNRKNFVLLVEEMKILSDSSNRSKWKGDSVTKERLNALYKVLQINGLYDSAYPFNIPFTKDGRNAFIDTEYYNIWPIKFQGMLNYLSSEMKEHWQFLIHEGER